MEFPADRCSKEQCSCRQSRNRRPGTKPLPGMGISTIIIGEDKNAGI